LLNVAVVDGGVGEAGVVGGRRGRTPVGVGVDGGLVVKLSKMKTWWNGLELREGRS